MRDNWNVLDVARGHITSTSVDKKRGKSLQYTSYIAEVFATVQEDGFGEV